jgi:hypothetical protein
MRRDMSLIRELMLKLEDMPTDSFQVWSIQYDDELLAVDGRSMGEIAYHLKLILEAGFMEPHDGQGMTSFTYSGLTWAGHDFVDSVRDPEVWRQVKERAQQAGSFTVDLLIGLAKAYAKARLQAITGIHF